MKRILIIVAIWLSSSALFAETREMRDSLRHEFRVGWGDQQFETLVWHYTSSADYRYDNGDYLQTDHYRYTQHWFIEYQYRVNYWFGVGVQFDGSAVLWDNMLYDQDNDLIANIGTDHFYNLVFMPTARFTYLHRKYVSLYSSIGIGINVNGGTEMNIYGKYTDSSLALDIRAIGLEVGLNHWFGAIEFGGLFAMKNKNTVFMVDSRIFTASVGFRF